MTILPKPPAERPPDPERDAADLPLPLPHPRLRAAAAGPRGSPPPRWADRDRDRDRDRPGDRDRDRDRPGAAAGDRDRDRDRPGQDGPDGAAPGAGVGVGAGAGAPQAGMATGLSLSLSPGPGGSHWPRSRPAVAPEPGPARRRHRSGRKTHRPGPGLGLGLGLGPGPGLGLHHRHRHRPGRRLSPGPTALSPGTGSGVDSPSPGPGAPGVAAPSPGASGAAAGVAAGQEEGAGGYNSEDEYETAGRDEMQDPAQLEQEHGFEKALSEKKGFVLKRMKEDGACLFRAVADQVYGDQDMHDVVRKHCMDYLVKNADYFSNYVTEDFTTYINRKRVSSCHGNHIEMQAMAEMYNRPVEVYQYGAAGPDHLEPINTFHGIHQTEDEPIRVSYHRNVHYNSVVNPNKATIGVGLGLPAFKPGSADQSLMKSAIKTSEESWIEQQMLEDKKRATDWEATNEAIEEQVARESYLQWLRDQEKQARQPRKASATCSSATAAATSGPEEWSGRSPRQRSSAPSPEQQDPHTEGKPPSPGTAGTMGKPPSPCAPGTSCQVVEGGDRGPPPVPCPTIDCRALMQQMSPTAFGLADWEDDEILASVLAVSQQEYLDSMKKGRDPHREKSPDHS